jgi:outer membrane protein OmpA-like peptidoglycan-associated protein
MNRFLFIAIILTTVDCSLLNLHCVKAQGVELEWASLPQRVVVLQAGGRLNDMSLSYVGYGKYDHSMVLGPSLGLSYRHRIKSPLYCRADLLYVVRGVDLNWCDVKYSMWVPYVDFRPMLHLSLCRPWWEVVPYIALGFECSFTLPGRIDFGSNTVPSSTLALSKSNIKSFDLGFYAAVGADIHFEAFDRDFFLMVEVGTDFGFLNNFASAEQEGDAQVLIPELGHITNMGTRKNRGIEVSLGLGVPPAKKKNVHAEKPFPGTGFVLADYLKRDTIPQRPCSDTVIIDTLPAQSEPIISASARYRAENGQYKECYTLSDILYMVAHGKDVCNLSICMFDIKFEFDSYELTFGSRRQLDRIVKLLREYPKYNIHVGGHTDSIGSDEYNIRLSLNRASAVVDYLINNGISKDRLSYEGFGERYPIESNGTEYGRHINRRVEFELYCTSTRKVGLEVIDDGENNNEENE